jgi:hypothetical protein
VVIVVNFSSNERKTHGLAPTLEFHLDFRYYSQSLAAYVSCTVETDARTAACSAPSTIEKSRNHLGRKQCLPNCASLLAAHHELCSFTCTA